MGSRLDAVSGGQIATSSLPFALALWVRDGGALSPDSWVFPVVACTALCWLSGGWLSARRPREARPLALGAAIGLLVISAPLLLVSPALTLAMLLGLSLLVVVVWAGIPRRVESRLDSQTRGAALGCIAFSSAAYFVGRETPELVLCLLVSQAIVGLFALRWFLTRHREHPRRASAVFLVISLGLLLAIAAREQPVQSAVIGWVGAVVTALLIPPQGPKGFEDVGWWEPILGHPERLLVVTFLALCFTGFVLLALPASAADVGRVAPVDAAFTAVSAVCVTGLSVVDAATAFSGFGHAALLILIQLGGLGIMTFSTLAIRVLGARMSLRHEGAVAGLLSPGDRSRLYDATRRLLLFTFGCELVGALALWPAFLTKYGLWQALWRAVFTSVSGFCNAGFALETTNLVAYQSSPLVLHVVALLIIAGGLSPAVALSTPALLMGRRRSVQVTLAWLTTLLLLGSGFLFILAVEWGNSLSHLSAWDRVHNAWFQSATLRTAGFNSIDLTSLRSATTWLMIALMFIGGTPGGTAGGIKTTTLAVLALAVVSTIRGSSTVTVLGRTIPQRSIFRAAAITTVGAACVFIAVIALLLTQPIPLSEGLFEVVSALATVGLTIGGTAKLDGIGKLLIMLCMFAGRVGPLTLFMFLSQRSISEPWKRPEEEIDVG